MYRCGSCDYKKSLEILVARKLKCVEAIETTPVFGRDKLSLQRPVRVCDAPGGIAGKVRST